jgi:hypothetical protein
MREAKIIAKIENMEGLVNYREIMEQCDVMLLSRGSMGNCVDPEKMFLAQKMLLRVSELPRGGGGGGGRAVGCAGVCSCCRECAPCLSRCGARAQPTPGWPVRLQLLGSNRIVCAIALSVSDVLSVSATLMPLLLSRCAGVQLGWQAHLRHSGGGHHDRCTPAHPCRGDRCERASRCL